MNNEIKELLSKGCTEYISLLIKTLNVLNYEDIIDFYNLLLLAQTESRQIFIMGNGGSGTTASHFVCDFNKGLKFNNKNNFKCICLNDNMPSILAYANDLSYNNIFVEQLENYMNEKDIVIGISGSGNSKNIIKAIEYANKAGGISSCLVGYDGGELKKISKHCIHINIKNMQICEDIHLNILHMGMWVIKNFIYKNITN